ncbi:MAG: AMP-binding protein, partial [Candidatus Binatia bacterium]
IPDREALIWRDRAFSYRELRDRCRRAGRALRRLGLGCRRERSALEPWESGQDHVALYLYNCNEYLEALMGSLAARATAVNVNYRYVAKELVYLLENSRSRALVYHSAFAPMVSAVRRELAALEFLIQVDDGSGEPLLDGALDYERLLGAEPADPLDIPYSPDDLFIIYTGGTTGTPKGVLWRQEDIFYNLFGGHLPGFPKLESEERLLDHVRMGIGGRIVVAMPFMHGAGAGAAFNTWHRGGTIVLPDESRRLDPRFFWKAVERHRVETLMLIGDAFALPLIEALRDEPFDVSSVRVVTSTAAVLSPNVKQELVSLLPEGVLVVESVGSTETGFQAMSTLPGVDAARPVAFELREGTVLLDPDRRGFLDVATARKGDDGDVGWTARTGHLPLGYLGDREKTLETFPVIGGARCAIAGDRARYDDEGRLVLLGREAMCVNTGGEKVYVEEVERIVKSHPAIRDVLVVGRPSERWGQEVTAVVSLRPGAVRPAVGELRAHCASRLAGYKLPRAIVVAPEISHLANGKPDYAWAKRYAIDNE